jgi:hypothetical protein
VRSLAAELTKASALRRWIAIIKSSSLDHRQ